MPPHQTLTALLCVTLLACAVGVEDVGSLPEAILDGAPVPDASGAPSGPIPGLPGGEPLVPPAVITYDAGNPWSTDARVEVVVIDAGTGGPSLPDGSGSGQGATTSDSSVGQPSNPGSSDAGSATSDASTSPTPSSDAGSVPTPTDAGYTPPEAGPMCQAAT
ncbi:MAG TPA: hypothetical protein VFZ61_25205, partial [Polyangiales bacterium]